MGPHRLNGVAKLLYMGADLLEEGGDARTVQVGIEQSNLEALGRERHGQMGGNRALADAAFS
jgi:hypothetical protein